MKVSLDHKEVVSLDLLANPEVMLLDKLHYQINSHQVLKDHLVALEELDLLVEPDQMDRLVELEASVVSVQMDLLAESEESVVSAQMDLMVHSVLSVVLSDHKMTYSLLLAVITLQFLVYMVLTIQHTLQFLKLRSIVNTSNGQVTMLMSKLVAKCSTFVH